MKNSQINLLVLLALALCGLCAFQWYEQTVQRNEIATLNGMVYDRDVSIRDATNSIATANQQIQQMDSHLAEIKAVAATNEQVMVSQKAEITRLRFSEINLTNEVAQYKVAVATMEEKLKQAYASLQTQNETITNLVAQRDDLVKKYNDEVKDRNDVVAKYNDLAARIEKNQSQEK